MIHLQNSIRRLELHAEQLIIHLGSMQRSATGAERMRSVLLIVLHRLVVLKTKREQFEDELALDRVAPR